MVEVKSQAHEERERKVWQEETEDLDDKDRTSSSQRQRQIPTAIHTYLHISVCPTCRKPLAMWLEIDTVHWVFGVPYNLLRCGLHFDAVGDLSLPL